eukprot:CAMPEP_0118989120 /NCGR_PEP_ID=MMETSP1173-20130426/47378_1 /TAXON_ID=1034831 /ORGANISM="Rhizochromulina marina cf, Strain CCMP1243" /LENGTH=37 /DNA_ID= /DNA_START= /DNA_END= /DNA_ORIENTATION=
MYIRTDSRAASPKPPDPPEPLAEAPMGRRPGDFAQWR